jgi:hypothetical protein
VKLNSQGSTSTSTDHKPTPNEDEDSDKEENKTPKSKAFKGISMEEFSQLVIPKSVMTDGILFIWVEKEYIMDVVRFLEK